MKTFNFQGTLIALLQLFLFLIAHLRWHVQIRRGLLGAPSSPPLRWLSSWSQLDLFFNATQHFHFWVLHCIRFLSLASGDLSQCLQRTGVTLKHHGTSYHSVSRFREEIKLQSDLYCTQKSWRFECLKFTSCYAASHPVKVRNIPGVYI